MKILRFCELESTQTYAKNFTGELPVAVVAERQTTGLGRNGEWVSEFGNLYVTYAMEHHSTQLHLLTHETYLAIARILDQYGIASQLGNGEEREEGYYPNDVIVANAKIAGILCDVDAERVYIGIGVNVTNAPRLKRATTCMAEHGFNGEVEEVLLALTEQIKARFNI